MRTMDVTTAVETWLRLGPDWPAPGEVGAIRAEDVILERPTSDDVAALVREYGIIRDRECSSVLVNAKDAFGPMSLLCAAIEDGADPMTLADRLCDLMEAVGGPQAPLGAVDVPDEAAARLARSPSRIPIPRSDHGFLPVSEYLTAPIADGVLIALRETMPMWFPTGDGGEDELAGSPPVVVVAGFLDRHGDMFAGPPDMDRHRWTIRCHSRRDLPMAAADALVGRWISPDGAWDRRREALSAVLDDIRGNRDDPVARSREWTLRSHSSPDCGIIGPII